jgi:hypothetical protein
MRACGDAVRLGLMGRTLCVHSGDDGVVVAVNGEVDTCTEGSL